MGAVGKVFLVIGVLTLSLILWQITFTDGGLLETAWNAVANLINGAWENVTGVTGARLMPLYREIFTGGAERLDQVGPR